MAEALRADGSQRRFDPQTVDTLLKINPPADNPSWGQQRIANELWLKLGLKVSPRTIRKYLPNRPKPTAGRYVSLQRWLIFLRNHAQALVACDFCIAVTATFKIL